VSWRGRREERERERYGRTDGRRQGRELPSVDEREAGAVAAGTAIAWYAQPRPGRQSRVGGGGGRRELGDEYYTVKTQFVLSSAI